MKKIKTIGIKEKGKDFRVQNNKAFREKLKELPNGKYLLTIEKYYRKSTPSQFGWLYAVIYPLTLIALNDAGYEFTNIDQVDVFFKSLFATKEILNRETGEIMKLPQSKSEFLTIDQMAYCEQIRQYTSEYLGAVIPDPDPNWREKNVL